MHVGVSICDCDGVDVCVSVCVVGCESVAERPSACAGAAN